MHQAQDATFGSRIAPPSSHAASCTQRNTYTSRFPQGKEKGKGKGKRKGNYWRETLSRCRVRGNQKRVSEPDRQYTGERQRACRNRA
eukprot:6373052-Alexandrium_andersonii.AAC.1